MARINLLPWREWERERRKKGFLTNLAAVLVVAGLLVFAGAWMLDNRIEHQEARNEFLKKEIAVLDEKIAEIRDLQKTRDELLARMRVIQELQGNRPVIVRVFDELVRTLATGVHFKNLKMTGKPADRQRRRGVEQPDLQPDAQSGWLRLVRQSEPAQHQGRPRQFGLRRAGEQFQPDVRADQSEQDR